MYNVLIEKKWILKEVNKSTVENLEKNMPATSRKLCSLFAVRGIKTYEDAASFFNPSIQNLHSPFDLADMDMAVERIFSAIRNEENILIFGDYDVDGTASTAMLLRFLREIYNPEKVFYYIPDRYDEGYGLSRKGIEWAGKAGVSLIITLDCGISSAPLISDSISEDIDYIICDHHLPGTTIPPAKAIINPRLPGRDYPFKELCGCGLTFKLIQAICLQLKLNERQYLRYLDLVALATGADVVPVLGENRILAYHGLKQLNENPCVGIKALQETNSGTGSYSLSQIIFGIAPKINAAGRLEHGKIAVELLSTEDPAKARALATKLSELNDKRRSYDSEITKEAILMLQNDKEFHHKNSIVVFKESWHQGVIGIVAARLVETYYRPAIVLTFNQQQGICGSARSIPSFNIFNAINSCKTHLEKFGGHHAAAGLTLKPGSLMEFKRQFEDVVSNSMLPSIQNPILPIDLEITLEDINYRFYNTILRMEPFGHENPKPVFLTRNLKAWDIRIVGGNHLRMGFRTKENKMFQAIGFNLKTKFSLAKESSSLDIAYTIAENVWNNHRFLQIKLLDLRNSFH